MNTTIILSLGFVELIFFAGLTLPAAHAAVLSGEISTSGDPATRHTYIKSEDSESSTLICPKGRNFELTQLAGTSVTLDGSYQQHKRLKQPCFFAESFEVNEIAKGRPAITGRLRMIEKGRYAVVNNQGKTWSLSKLAPGLKEMVNKEGIFDLVASDASTGETTWLVARAFTKPEP